MYKRSGYNPNDYAWVIKSGGDKFLAVRKEAIAGRAAWRDKYYKSLFFSDALLSQMRALKTVRPKIIFGRKFKFWGRRQGLMNAPDVWRSIYRTALRVAAMERQKL